MEKVSIIIPVYNAEKWLRRCVDSVLSQTYRDIEVILVDDGSKDSSPGICDKYSAEDPRIKVIHKQNEGVSAARNDGIAAATGEFIAFLDADDWIENGYLESLMKYCDYPLVITGYKRQGAADGERGPHETKDLLIRYLPDVLKDYAKEDDYWVFVWGKIFRTDIIKSNNLKFCNGMKYLEDSCFVIDYLSLIEKLKIVKTCKLHHLIEKTKYNKYYMNYEQLRLHMNFQYQSLIKLEEKCGMDLLKFRKELSRLHFNNFRRYLLWGTDPISVRINQLIYFLKNRKDLIYKDIKYRKSEKILFAVLYIMIR